MYYLDCLTSAWVWFQSVTLTYYSFFFFFKSQALKIVCICLQVVYRFWFCAFDAYCHLCLIDLRENVFGYILMFILNSLFFCHFSLFCFSSTFYYYILFFWRGGGGRIPFEHFVCLPVCCPDSCFVSVGHDGHLYWLYIYLFRSFFSLPF